MIGASTSNKALAEAIDQVLKTNGFNSHDINVLEEAAQRIRELPDEE
jgi:hypothetical protein